MHRVTLIPGDGIGPEISKAALRVLEASGARIAWERFEAGRPAIEESGTPLPKEVLESIRKNGVALKGPVTTPLGSGFRSVNVELRKSLDLYASVRPYRSYAGIKSRYDSVNLVVIRENTEGLYSGIEFEQGKPETADLIRSLGRIAEIRPDSGISIKPISPYASERISRFAFEYACSHGRSRVTCSTKSNIMKFSDGLFMSSAEAVSKQYPELGYEHILIDNLCMQLVQDPSKFDVLVLPNLYGDIVSDLCAGLVGGLGISSGANIGDTCAVFEPVHGSAPDIAGKGIANPSAMILSGAMMLRHLGEEDAAARIERAFANVVSAGKSLTPDLCGADATPAGTEGMADALIRAMS